ncbi:MAG: hypothetical protein AAF716_10260 [Cyanobacteria bacterium P01_D01_bin.1]
MDSPVRKLAKAIEQSVRVVRRHASQDEDLAKAHNALCEVLDMLNRKLEEERTGKIPKTWKRLT